MQILKHGDKTEIGERGINLSGGQKARISLARAVYANKNIILMDDPISALDANVKKQIFKNVFAKQLKGKTIILATHALDFLKQVDRIFLMKEGEIIKTGHYSEMEDCPEIKELVAIHSVNVEEQTKEEDNEKEEVAATSSDQDGELSDSTAEDEKEKKNDEGEENEKEDDGKMIDDEHDEVLENSWTVFFMYINKYMGGYKTVLQNIVLSMTLILLFLSIETWYGKWTSSPEQNSEVYSFAGVQVLLVFASCIGIILRITIVQKASTMGEIKLHNDMINRIVKAPINLYFDVTPVGRIINRFSRDLGNVQDHFSHMVAWFTWMVFVLIQSSITTLYAVPQLIISYPIVFAILYRIFRYYTPALKETCKLESIAHSPIGSHVTETINGASTIRAFKRTDSFIKKYHELQDQNNVASIWEHGCFVSMLIKL